MCDDCVVGISDHACTAPGTWRVVETGDLDFEINENLFSIVEIIFSHTHSNFTHLIISTSSLV